MALTQIDDRGLKTPIDLLDNEKIRFGTGSDFEISHNGTDNLLVSGTGLIRIRHSNEDAIITNANGAVEIYYDNSKKFETTSNGIEISGIAKLKAGNQLELDNGFNNKAAKIQNAEGSGTSDLRFFTGSTPAENFRITASGNAWLPNDNGKLMCGTGTDLQIWHGGTDSHITNATGQLKLGCDTVRITNAAVSETQALFTANGSAELYYDDSKKLETISGGATVTGSLGVNNSSPLYPLHLKNAMGSSPYWIHMEVTGTNTTGGGAGIAFDTSATNQASNNGLFLATISGERSASADGSNNLVFKTSKANAAGDGSLTSGPKTQMVITEDGNVGIGTTPEEIFHIKGPSEAVNARDGVLLQHSTDSDAADTGLPLVWSGRISNSLANYGLASICGRKENSTGGDGASYLQFATCNAAGALAEKLRLDSSGKVGINQTPAVSYLEISHTGTNSPVNHIELNTPNVSDGGGSGIFFKNSGATGSTYTNRYGSRIHTIRENNGASVFVISNEKTGGTTGLIEAVRIDADQNVKVSNGNLVIGTSGKGIDFSATSDAGGMTNELLDDYEEGTFTPTWNTGSASSAMFDSVVYTSTSGHYTKIGNIVTFSIKIKCSSVTNANNESHVLINSLPFTSSSTAGTESGATFNYAKAVSQAAAEDVLPTLHVGGNQSQLSFWETGGSTYKTGNGHNDFTETLHIHGHYPVP